MAVKEALAIVVQTRAPVLLWGPPGTGKTQFFQALGRALELHVETVVASVREPSDFGGMPILTDGDYVLAPPRWAKRLAAAERALLFLDEINTAPPAVQATLLRVVLEQVVGELQLPPTVATVAAANPPEQAAGGWDLTPPLANRFCHFTWSVAADEWIEGTLAGWPAPKVVKLPPNWEALIPAQAAVVTAFIKARPHLLLAIPQNESEAGRAWPSPRTWTAAIRQLAAASAVVAGDEVATHLVAGCVGEGAALEFVAWRAALDLPDPESVLAEPDKFKLPKRGDQQYAVLAGVVAVTIARLTTERWLAAWRVLARAAAQGSADVAAAAAKALAGARRPDLPLPVEDVRAFVPLLKAAGLGVWGVTR